ncbi:hypothetical protein LTR86_010567 [Recurvomyces mirabilis]|nr:hypothetical protein LTR86_010567 [Recurvomyces mirabilis]
MSASHGRDVAGAEAKPRFLFRASSNQSRGGPKGNTLTTVDPLARSQTVDYHSCLAAIPRSRARSMLEHHFLWHYEHDSEFSSWSTSLLWVLVHTIRKQVIRHDTNILIYVLDTAGVEDNRIHSALKLLEVFNLGHHEQLLEYCKGEYLVHRLLRATMGFKAVKLEKVTHAGLYEVFPDLQSSAAAGHLYLRVRDHLRPLYFDRIWPLSYAEVLGLKRHGQCFGGTWEAVMTIAFLGMRRHRGESNRVQTLIAGLQYLPVRPAPTCTPTRSTISNESEQDSPEAQKFGALLNSLYGAISEKKKSTDVLTQIDDLVIGVETLGSKYKRNSWTTSS